MTLTVNGHEAEPGCYVEGHWGQYGPDHLAGQAEGFGWRGDGSSDEWPLEGYGNDPRYWRRVADRFGDDHKSCPWERFHEAGDAVLEWLNDNTVGGYWEWWEGECFLRSYVCPECGRDARDPVTAYAVAPCDYCCDADDPGR